MPCCLLPIPFTDTGATSPRSQTAWACRSERKLVHEGKHSTSGLHQLPGLAEKQERNWIWYNTQIHFTAGNCKDSLCNRRDDREKGIFTGYRIVWVGKSLWRPPSPTPPPRQDHIEQVTHERVHTGPPTAIPGVGQALLPPPPKGPGSAGSVTLAGWFLIFLARFFSRAPDISGGVAEPLRSGQRRGEVGGRCRRSRSPRHQPQRSAHSRRGLHRHTWTPTLLHCACARPGTTLKDYISQRPRGRWGAGCALAER